MEYAHPAWDISSVDFAEHPRKMLLGNQIIDLE
jgi:hypothetical protein